MVGVLMRKRMMKQLLLSLFTALLLLCQCTPAVGKVKREGGLEEKQNIPGKPQEVQGVIQAEEKSGASPEDLNWESGNQALHDIFQDIRFDFDMNTLKPEGLKILADITRAMTGAKELKVRIEGHCDERGSDEYNLALGEKRAASVRTYLVKSGIEESRMEMISYGEERPLVPGHSEEAYTQNRRAHFEVLK